MSDQDTLNAEGVKLDTLILNTGTLITTTTDLVAEVNALKIANPSLDFTAIDAKLAAAETAVDNANAAIPDPGPPPVVQVSKQPKPAV